MAAMVIVTAIPQLLFLLDRGSAWNGANASMHPDEVAYSDYVGSLIRGRPRRNDPLTGRTDHSTSAVPESLFSIQLIPPYVLALPARWLGLSASTMFIVGPLLTAAASSLALFWFLSLLTRDSRLSASAVCFVFAFGTIIAVQGIVRYVPTLNFLVPLWLAEWVRPASAYHLQFVRFYQPAIGFPLFFVLCAVVWLALTSNSTRRRIVLGVGAGITFVLLVFCYFYLWTAASAWLVSIAILWLVGRPNERKSVLIVFGLIAVIAAPAMWIYFMMLSHRAATVDSAQALVLTHEPDLFRVCEIVVLVLLGILVVGAIRKTLSWRDPLFLFATSLALCVVGIFNQQVLTGRSLQPIHYEWFIGNYCALAMIALTLSLLWRSKDGRSFSDKKLLIVAVIALLWAVCEVWLTASINLKLNRQIDEMQLVSQRLTQLAESDGTVEAVRNGGTVPVVLVGNLKLADRLPTDAPQAVLWSPRMLIFPGISEEENNERFFRQMYFLGDDSKSFSSKFNDREWNFYAGMFPYHRLSRVVSGSNTRVSAEEVREQVQKFVDYSSAFTGERSRALKLSYMVLSADQKVNWSNVDRWYVRDQGERFGSFVLYSLKLKDQP
jgi:hypothetical protein